MLIIAGIIKIPASRYASTVEGPADAVASPGSRKNPLLNIAPVLIT